MDDAMAGSFAPRLGRRMGLASSAPDNLHVVVVNKDGQVLLYRWDAGEEPSTGVCTGPWPLPGVTAVGTPAVTTAGPGSLDVFVRTDGNELAWASIGPGDLFTGWVRGAHYLAFDPVVASCRPGRIDLFAPSVTGALRQWRVEDRQWQPEHLREWGCGVPAIIASPTSYELYGVRPNGDLLRRTLSIGSDAWELEELPGAARPGIVATAPTDDEVPIEGNRRRVDLFGPSGGVGITHWGQRVYGGSWYCDPPQGQYGPWLDGPALDEAVGCVVGGYRVFTRDEEHHPVVWTWTYQPPHQGLWDPETLEAVADELPVGLSRGQTDSIIYFENGVLTHRFSRPDMTGDVWETARWDQPLVETDWPSGAQIRPHYLAARPEDLVLLGVSSSGMELHTGPEPALVAGPDATLYLTLPPQHVGEEVTPDDEPLEPGSTLRSRLSGVSQLAFSVAGGTRVPLDVPGLLKALGSPELTLLGIPELTPLGSRDQNLRTVLEIPWHMAISPTDTGLILQHAQLPQSSSDGTALWSTRIHRPDGVPFSIKPLAVDANDPFEMPLSAGGRTTIRNLPADDFAFSRLELSALGGTLEARADNPGFEWRHHAVLGRDQKVITLWRGVLLPFGHLATYVETTERHTRPDEGDGEVPEPIAALRKSWLLKITEPVVDLVGDSPFPFDKVELTTTTFGNLDPPTWKTAPRPVDLDSLQAQLDNLDYTLGRLRGVVDGWPFEPSPELRAEGDDDAAVYLKTLIEKVRVEAARAAAADGIDLNVMFRPERNGALAFGIRASGPDVNLEFSMPLVFVSDLDLPNDLGLAAYRTLGNAALLSWIRDTLGSGVVALPGVRLNLRPGEGLAGTTHEVHALNFGVEARDGGFHPTLGWDLPPDPAQDMTPAGTAPDLTPGAPTDPGWAADVGLPSIRHLTGGDGLARVAFPTEAASDVVLDIVDGLEVDLAAQAEKIGALASPSFVATAISAASGPIAAVRLLPGGQPDPKSLLGEGAKLLGFDLRTLIGSVPHPPRIEQDPYVKYTWEGIKLHGVGPLLASEASTLDIVSQAGPEPSTTSTLTNVSLSLPPGTPLLQLDFASLTFSQTGNDPPALKVGKVDAKFKGTLELLSELQKKVGLGSAVPAIATSGDGVVVRYVLPIPEVACGAFRMSNATFSAAVEIPFRPPGIRVVLGFASKQSPFNLSVLTFGGGGYVRVVLNALEVGNDNLGIEALEASFEFGASLAVNLGIVKAEVHVLGGVTLLSTDGVWMFTGFLRMGGSVNLLGLVSVVIELRLELTYDGVKKEMWGRATLVVEIDLTLTSFPVELDSGIWVFAGGEDEKPHPALRESDSREAFQTYYASMARSELR
jgi:hypothetical protein